MTLKIVLFAPIPSASVSTAAAVNAGALRIIRTANNRSCATVAHADHRLPPTSAS